MMQILLTQKHRFILLFSIFFFSLSASNTIYAQQDDKENTNYKWVEDSSDSYDSYDYDDYKTETSPPTYTPPAQNGKLFLGGFLLGTFVFLASVIGAICLFIFYDPPARDSYETYNGIGGGLLFVAFVCIANPILFFFENISWLTVFFETKHTESASIVLVRFASFSLDICLLTLSLLILVCFFMRRTSTPRLFLIMLLLWLVASTSNITLAVIMERDSGYFTKEVFRILFTGVLWLPFFIMTDRVYGTFTVRRKSDEDTPTHFYNPHNPYNPNSGKY